MEREFIFKNSKKTYKGVPVIASNMDTVGTFEMAEALAKVIFTSIDYATPNMTQVTPLCTIHYPPPPPPSHPSTICSLLCTSTIQ